MCLASTNAIFKTRRISLERKPTFFKCIARLTVRYHVCPFIRQIYYLYELIFLSFLDTPCVTNSAKHCVSHRPTREHRTVLNLSAVRTLFVQCRVCPSVGSITINPTFFSHSLIHHLEIPNGSYLRPPTPLHIMDRY